MHPAKVNRWKAKYVAPFHKMVEGKTVVDVQQCCDALWNFTRADGSQVKVLKSAMVGPTWFGACMDTRDASVFCGVVFNRTRKSGAKEGCEWSYIQDCDSGLPQDHRCPPAILSMLTSPADPLAVEWRNECREYHKKHRVNRKCRPKPFAPFGVIYKYCEETNSHIISSLSHTRLTGFQGVKYSAERRTADEAIRAFVLKYGTERQKNILTSHSRAQAKVA